VSQDKVLVFIPVKNEEKTIKKIINDIADVHPSWDILVIDDESTDDTIKEASKTKARVVSLVMNTLGRSSVITSFMIAYTGKYDYMVKIDGDGQQEVSVLWPLIQALKNNQADIVIGSRYVKKTPETDSFIKVIGRVTSSALINFKTRGKSKITDCTSGVKAWNAKSIRLLSSMYFNDGMCHGTVYLQREIIFAARNGLRIIEIPAFYKKREHGKSKSFNLINMLSYPFRFLFLLIS